MALGLRRRHTRGNVIPTASMADIAFLLLIFFMVTAIFRQDPGLAVDLPRAEAGGKPGPEPVARISIDRDGRIAVDGRFVQVGDVAPIIGRRLAAEPALVVALRADARTPYRLVSAVMDALREVDALRVSLDARPAAGPGGAD
ncbi:MAG: ExbD/TolR family protein [Candidatus Krumholzibacteriia bacterium]